MRALVVVVVVAVDESTYFRICDEWRWGNSLSLHLRGSRFEGRDVVTWLQVFVECLAERMHPAFVAAYDVKELDAKNLSRADGATRAIGRDIARWLPGLYWITVFGQPYIDVIGIKKLTTSPGYDVKRLGDTVRIQLSKNPYDWQTSDYLMAEHAVETHLGREYFFNRHHPERPHVRFPFSFDTQVS